MFVSQDAHCDPVPDIPLSNGSLYQPGTCWIDMYNAICSAKHFIYIAGAARGLVPMSADRACPSILSCNTLGRQQGA